MSEDSTQDTQVGQYAGVPARVGDYEPTPVQQEMLRRIMECESVRSICEDPNMPSRTTVLSWLAKDEGFRLAYGLAKQLSSDQLEEEVLEIADDSTGDFVMGEKGLEFDREHVARAKLRIEARQWAASKRNPKKYGVSSTVNVNDVTEIPPERTTAERFARLAAMAQKTLTQHEKEPGDDE